MLMRTCTDRRTAVRFIPERRRTDFTSLTERQAAERAGLDPTRDVKRDCADYYLLSYLRRPHYVAAAAQLLDDLVGELAPEFARYLDLACGGELRHASTWPCDVRCPVLGSGTDRSVAWRNWLDWETPEVRAAFAAEMFEACSWPSRNYGGEPWAEIASTLHAFVSGNVAPDLFLDRVWNLQHHGGIVLNKVYETNGIGDVLEAHGSDDHDTLLQNASDASRHLWQRTFSGAPRTIQEVRESLRLWHRLALEPALS